MTTHCIGLCGETIHCTERTVLYGYSFDPTDNNYLIYNVWHVELVI